jgi:hypothetical protein
MHIDVYYKVDQHAADVKRVITDMQYHMFSLTTIKCMKSICENVQNTYTICLLFIVTQAQTSLPLETSDSSFSYPTNHTHLPLSSVPHILICLF